MGLPSCCRRAGRSPTPKNLGYFNEKKINLIPPFQRGHVWTLPHRQRLIRNIVNGRPIPAIFLYKEAEGTKYTYNILDGKQRLESLLMFIGSHRTDVRINNVNQYFFSDKEKNAINFEIDLESGKTTFANLSEDKVRDFREYAIPTIEIELEGSSLDEIIDLFIDINQQGYKVNRFDIVKAMRKKNSLLEDVFKLIAVQQKRGEDMFYKKRRTDFTRALEKLQMIQSLQDANSKVDRMWERLTEIVLFCRTQKHRAPAQILQSFIRGKDQEERAKISAAEMKALRSCFKFLTACYAHNGFGKSRFATDQTHFYTMVTSLLASKLFEGSPSDKAKLQRKLSAFSKLIDGGTLPADRKLATAIRDYRQKSTKQTTHLGQREDRQALFLKIIDAI